MKFAKLGTLFLGICLSPALLGQKPDSVKIRHCVSLQFGVNQLREENLMPKVSTGTIIEVSYGFEKQTRCWQHFHFTVGYSRLKTKAEELSKTMNIKLNTGYSRAYLVAGKRQFKYYIGPEINLSYNFSFLPNWDDSHLYWGDYLAIGANQLFLLNFKNGKAWISSVSLPLFSVFSRPDLYRLYKIDKVNFGGILSNLHSHPAVGFWESAFHLQFQTEFRFPLGKNKREAITYSFEFLRIKKITGNPFTQLSHQLGIKFYL